MDNKKILKIFFAFMGVFVCLAIVEISIKLINKKTNEYIENKAEKKHEEMVYNSDAEKEKRQITTFLDDMIKATNERDYNYLILNMDKYYNDYMFQGDEEKLKDYIENNVKLTNNYQIENIQYSKGKYQVTAKFEKDNGESFVQGFTVEALNSNTCSFMFGEYISFSKVDKKAIYGKTKYNILYYIETKYISRYVVEIDNLSDKDETLSFIETPKMIFDNGETKLGVYSVKDELELKQKSRIELSFSKQNKYPDTITFYVRKGENEEKIDILFSE